MKVRLTVDMEVPDSFIMEGEYETASIRQFIWDHTIHELLMLYTHRLFKAGCEKEPAMKEALIRLNEQLADMFETCQYKIEKVTE
jgi:hypothetical protein